MNSPGMSLPCVNHFTCQALCSVCSHLDELMSKQEEVTEPGISHALLLSCGLDYISGLLRIYTYSNLVPIHCTYLVFKSVCISELLNERCELQKQ